MKLFTEQCESCRHARRINGLFVGDCAAYQDGIPPAIRRGEIDHRHPYKGDHGIRWEPKDQDVKHPLDDGSNHG